MKRLVSFLTAMSMVLMLGACGSVVSDGSVAENPPAAPDAGKDAAIKVGLIVMDISNPYFVSCVEGAQAYCDKNGYELSVFDGAGDVTKQVAGMENLINAGCNVIDLRALDAAALADSVKAATDAGVFVSTYPEIDGCTTYLDYADYDRGYAEGEQAANWINEKLGGAAEVAVLTQPANETVVQRANGIKDAIAKIAPDAEIVAEAEGWVTDGAMTATETILQAHPNVKVICCVTDSGALGAYEAVNGAGLAADDFFIGGVDGDASALEKIKEGGIYRCTITSANLTGEETYYMIENLVKAAKGETFDYAFSSPTLAITADTVDEFMGKTPVYAN
ncbi:MAG: sugar ABC transporter substrate-binding protein [Eubacteriales bacterium]|nr:sugar ABC transporter substrate-binding protein [Eubacteriales bacterium]